jgi:ligand-binding sensor domain-containing protein
LLSNLQTLIFERKGTSIVGGIIALSILLLPALVTAQPFQWSTFTSTSNVVEMTVLDGRVWMATSGGLSAYDPAAQTFDVYTNTRGLAMNQCVAIGRDAHGFVWVAHADSRITRLNPATGQIAQVTDLQGEVFLITDILDVGDEVFVAANNGLYRFSYYAVVDNYRVRESIRALGTFPGETRVACLAAADTFLYAGTQYGIARASLNESQLSAPSVWENWTPANSPLPEGNVVAMQGYHRSGASDLLFAATPSRLVTFSGMSLFDQSLIGGVHAFSESFEGLAATSERVFTYDDSQNPPARWSLLNGSLRGIADVDGLPGATSGELIYLTGLQDTPSGTGGLSLGTRALPPDTIVWGSTLRAPGIGGNFIMALALDPQGRLWVGGGGDAPGIFVRENENWRNYSLSNGYAQRFFASTPSGFIFDDDGGTWASCVGNGVAWFRGDSIDFFNNRDSSGFALVNGVLRKRFSGITVDSNYVESYVARDARGNVFISNLEAVNGISLMCVTREWIAQGNNRSPWTYYSCLLGGQSSDYAAIGRLLIDPLQRVWVGAGRNGTRTFVVDPRGTPSDTVGDQWFAYLPADLRDPVTCYEEPNKEVYTWAVDAQSYLWIGTINGAYYTQGGVPFDLNQLRFVCVVDLPIGHRVNAIHVDAHDNKWFGTDEGVAVLDKNFVWVHVFQTAGSPDNRSNLVSNNVLAITSDARTGDVWIGTSDGLSRFSSPYVSLGGELGDVWPYPNPFRADGKHRMRVHPQRLGGRFDELRVFTVSGRLVRKLNWTEMTDPRTAGGWDGRNDDGELVAGGVYVLIASSNDGKSAIGKVAVLGR